LFRIFITMFINGNLDILLKARTRTRRFELEKLTNDLISFQDVMALC